MSENSNEKLGNKGLKLRIIAIILLLGVMSITYFVINTLIGSGFFIEEKDHKEPEYKFAEADFDYDIFSDEKYLEKIAAGLISHSDGTTKVTVNEEYYGNYSEAANLIFTLVKAAQTGDADTYNACFSPAYIAAAGKHPDFTMQQIYDVVIIEGETLNKGSFYQTDIALEYKIRENNGTLRSDIESDSVRTQYLRITTKNPSEKPLIDSVQIEMVQFSDQIEPDTYKVLNIVVVSTVSAAIIGAAVVYAIITFKKTKKYPIQ